MYDAGVAAAPVAFYNTSPASNELNQNSLPFVAFHHHLPGTSSREFTVNRWPTSCHRTAPDLLIVQHETDPGVHSLHL
jgi:hypothetical protein